MSPSSVQRPTTEDSRQIVLRIHHPQHHLMRQRHGVYQSPSCARLVCVQWPSRQTTWRPISRNNDPCPKLVFYRCRSGTTNLCSMYLGSRVLAISQGFRRAEASPHAVLKMTGYRPCLKALREMSWFFFKSATSRVSRSQPNINFATSLSTNVLARPYPFALFPCCLHQHLSRVLCFPWRLR